MEEGEAMTMLVCGWLAMATIFSATQVDADRAAVTWVYTVVSTPDFIGPFLGNSPSFQPPVEVKVTRPRKAPTKAEMSAHYEAIVDASGRTTIERALAVSSRAGDQAARRIIGTWRFKAARFEGKPIRVRIGIQIHQIPAALR